MSEHHPEDTASEDTASEDTITIASSTAVNEDDISSISIIGDGDDDDDDDGDDGDDGDDNDDDDSCSTVSSGSHWSQSSRNPDSAAYRVIFKQAVQAVKMLLGNVSDEIIGNRLIDLIEAYGPR